MTARLLPALQECFKSEYVSVRIEAAMVTKFCRFTTVCDKLDGRFPFFCVIGYYHHHHHHHHHYYYYYYYYHYYHYYHNYP